MPYIAWTTLRPNFPPCTWGDLKQLMLNWRNQKAEVTIDLAVEYYKAFSEINLDYSDGIFGETSKQSNKKATATDDESQRKLIKTRSFFGCQKTREMAQGPTLI